DIGDILGEGKAGVAVDRFDAATLTAALRRLIEHPPSRPTVRALARRWFDLKTGIERYDILYRSMSSPLDERDRAQ
ncbi:MAG: glycosyltransferase, partial [Sphingomicrobium sp.]